MSEYFKRLLLNENVDIEVIKAIDDLISDDAYAASWNAVTDVAASKNAIYNQTQLLSATSHRHDGDTLELDGVNSDGGAFAFGTTGNISVDMLNAAATIFSITNSGIGAASLDVTGNITVSGTVDGVDIAARDHAIYTDAEVDARIVVQNTNPVGTIDVAIDALIATHAAIAAAHHTATVSGDIDHNATLNTHNLTTDLTAQIETIITAEIVGGQSIDNAIDTLITTHTAVATAHHTAPTVSDIAYNAITWNTNIDALTKNAIRDWVETHIASATVHHTATVASDLNHNDLANLNAGTVYEHISAAQVAALHAVAVAGDFNHNDLANLNAGTAYEHISAAQVAALHAEAHTHDTDTLQLDGINSNGGAFAFATTGSISVDMVNAGATIFSITNSGAGVASLDVTGNITVSGTVDTVDISALSITNMPTAVNNWKSYATNGTGIMTEIAVGAAGTFLTGNGVAAAPSFQAQPAPIAHVHDTDTLQLDGVNSNGGAFTFNTTGAITFNQNLGFAGAQTVDGIDISAISITAMPTAVNNWKMYCTNGAGVMTEIATGAAASILTGNGVGAAPSFQAGGAGGESFAATLAIGNESDGANVIIDSSGDLIVYSDDKVTEKARIDGATGNITTAGTVDGVDIAARDHAKYTDAEAHAYIEANALTITGGLQMSGVNITMAGAETVDGKDVSGLGTDAEAHAYVESNALTLTEDLTMSGNDIILGASTAVRIESEPADSSYTGITLDIDTTGCATYDAVYVDGANSVLPADADAIGTMPIIGVVVAANKILTHGVVRSDASWAIAAGATVYGSTTAGELSGTAPVGSGDVVQVVGVAIGADMIFISPSLDWVVIA